MLQTFSLDLLSFPLFCWITISFHILSSQSVKTFIYCNSPVIFWVKAFWKNSLHLNVIRILIGRGDEHVFTMLHILRGLWVGTPLWLNHMKGDIATSQQNPHSCSCLHQLRWSWVPYILQWMGNGLTLRFVKFLKNYSQWLSNTGMMSGIPLSWLSGLYFHSEMYCHGCPEALILPEPIQVIFSINTPDPHNWVGLCVHKERSSVCRAYACDALQTPFNLRATILHWKEFSSSEHLFYWNVQV